MRTANSLAVLLVVASAVGLSCTGLNAADQLDPAGGGASMFSPGTVGGQCTPSESGCQWEANACEADPACAKWYACVLKQPADSNVQKAIATCQDTALSASQQKLVNCLLRSEACAGLVPPTGGAETGADAATVPGDFGDSEGGTNGGGSCADPPPPVDPTGQGCYDCIINSCCKLVQDPTTQCYPLKHTTACWKGVERQYAMEDCLYDSQQPGTDVEFTSEAHGVLVDLGVMACFLKTCSDVCAPPEERCCMECQKKNCADQLDAYLASAAAQDWQWCHTHCDYGNEATPGTPVVEAEACRAKCDTDFAAGYEIVNALIGCKYDQCPSCSNLP